ncbi:type III-A CRISPR-associated protein Csm2, partial [uncultured Mailhella sp.]|uniref:type III-A CRISPR-associated protein Csm2 n=1 Tax=uncultured Mailhella sp. TaxID=1981031 RepID=UPI002634BC66
TWNYQKCSDEAFAGILPQIKILKAKAAYAKGRKVVPSAFSDWIAQHVDAINKPADFKAFLLHFEAVVGFCYGEGLKD